MSDWVGNRISTYATLGASNHSNTDRQTDDYYATDPIAVDALIRDGGVTFTNKIWECACGEGHLSNKLKEYGCEVYSTDLINRGYGDGIIDFLNFSDRVDMDIVTNPPYKFAKEFIEHAMDITSEGNRVFMFLKVQFLEGKSRKELFKKYPPKCVYVSSSRILCAKNGEFENKELNSSAVAYAWYEFVNGYMGDTIIKWIN